MSYHDRHSLGDSWCCREGDTGLDRGWQEYAGIPREFCHAVPGSTAAMWINRDNVVMRDAIAAIQDDDLVIVSLVGNDIRHAAEDGNLALREIFQASLAMSAAVKMIKSTGADVVLLQYADPYRGEIPDARRCVGVMNMIVEGVAAAHGCQLLDTRKILVSPDHFPGTDFHPTAAGHRAIAEYINQNWS